MLNKIDSFKTCLSLKADSKIGTLMHSNWECKLLQPLWRTIWQCLKKKIWSGNLICLKCNLNIHQLYLSQHYFSISTSVKLSINDGKTAEGEKYCTIFSKG